MPTSRRRTLTTLAALAVLAAGATTAWVLTADDDATVPDSVISAETDLGIVDLTVGDLDAMRRSRVG